MLKEQVDNKVECLECELPAQERLNYFTGQFLAERDFRDEQSYHIGKHREHNKYLHGYGTVCGLKVVQHPNPACQKRFVVIEPGLALDCCGREIWVREKVYVDLTKHLAPQNGNPVQLGQHLLISLCYAECKTEFVPALFSECGCDETGCEANRVRENYEVKVQRVSELPKPSDCEPSGVRLKWTTTINLAQAWRVALDAKRERLYVLTSADLSKVMVYDLNNYCLLDSIDIEAFSVDLAISPNGRFLYVIRQHAGNYVLLEISIENGERRNFSLSSGSLYPQVAIAATGGRVYVLDPNANAPRVIIWNTNDAGIISEPYATVATGDEPSAIAISPDGTWLFIVEAADTDKHVKAVNVATLSATLISVTDKPKLLAVSGDSQQRLYVVTAANKVRAFSVEQMFPEIGIIDLNLKPNESSIALQASSSGKWVFVLSQDDSGKGFIRAVNGEKFVSDSAHAVSDPVAVVSSPSDLLFAADARRLYAAGLGDERGSCGGVSVLEVEEDLCEEIFWRALEGCPECSEDACVPLAAIENYEQHLKLKGFTDQVIKNRIRPLAPSTETLRKVILCALEKGGSRGPQGERGPKGDQGVAGPGLETGLTQIDALSWIHNTGPNPLREVKRITPGGDLGIVIKFTQPVLVSAPSHPIDADHVFQVLVQDPRAVPNFGLICRCPVAGNVIPVHNIIVDDDDPGRIISADETSGPTALGVAFIFDQDIWNPLRPRSINELWVRLRGDFVIDEKGKAIDAEFVRAELPTGDRPRSSEVGIQGGLFESWFWIGQRPTSPRTIVILVNTASEEELTSLPGISKASAKRIISHRKTSPFTKIEDLLQVSGITESILEKIRDRITVE